MGKYKIVVITVFSVCILFGLALAQEQKIGGEITSEPITEATYIKKMTAILSTIKAVIDDKLVWVGKEKWFFSKKDPFGHQVAMGYYKSLRNTLNDVKKELLELDPPPQLLQTHRLWEEAVDTYIGAYSKAIEAHEKDDITIVNNEEAVLVQKAGQLFSRARQDLEQLIEKNKK